ncbi:tetratricopeptide repeat protein [Aliikangiella maris]|uniref:Tetratricopeptide repeat protein n=2 Tax=Aliikangiella maris TaxID=3162458 RepID=A0ABV2BSP0_9GAMM
MIYRQSNKRNGTFSRKPDLSAKYVCAIHASAIHASAMHVLIYFTLALLLSLSSLTIQAQSAPQPALKQQIKKINHAKDEFFNGRLKQAQQLLLPLAQAGHAEAQYYLALTYRQESQDLNNQELIFNYLLNSAQQHFIPAMWELGQAYENGIGIESDLIAATDWYRLSAQLEDKSPEDILFITNNNNAQSEKKSYSEIIEELELIAQKGDTESQVRLAAIYDTGIEQFRNSQKAFKWYHTAAETGHQYAQFMLGYFYCRGIGTQVDKKQANSWLEKSKRQSRCTQ